MSNRTEGSGSLGIDWNAAMEMSEGLAELLQALLLLFFALIEIWQERQEHEMRLARRDASRKRAADEQFRLLARLSKNVEALKIEAAENRDAAAVSRLFTMNVLELANLLPQLEGAMTANLLPELEGATTHSGFAAKLADFRKIPLGEINRILGKGVSSAPISNQNPEEETEGHKSPAATLKPRRPKL